MTVVQAAAEFPDVATQKMCFCILKKMTECQSKSIAASPEPQKLNYDPDSTGITNGHVSNGSVDGMTIRPEMSATFVDFLYNNVLPACFYGVSRVTDGDVNQVINESIACLKAIQSVRGSDEFVRYLQNQFFVKHFVNYQQKDALIAALLSNNQSAAKSAMAAIGAKAGK